MEWKYGGLTLQVAIEVEKERTILQLTQSRSFIHPTAIDRLPEEHVSAEACPFLQGSHSLG
jgi:hypothetical protein